MFFQKIYLNELQRLQFLLTVRDTILGDHEQILNSCNAVYLTNHSCSPSMVSQTVSSV